MAILNVGVDKDYTDIQSAIDAANTDDIISIYPGVYAGGLTIDKRVHLRGAGYDPDIDNIQIDVTVDDYILTVTYECIEPETIYIEGITMYCSPTSWRGGVANWSVAPALTVVINKCKIISKTSNYCLHHTDNSKSSFRLVNCYLHRGYAHILKSNTSQLVREVEKCELSDALYIYLGTSCTLTDYEITPGAVGYGPKYGTYFKDLFKGYVEGYVYLEDVPAIRTVRLYDYGKGELQDETTSSGTGYYKLNTFIDDTHYVVCLDDEAGQDYNHLIIKDPTIVQEA